MRRLTTTLAATALGVGIIAGGAVAPAAASQTWYYITGYSQSDCLRMQGYYHRLGAHIDSVCEYRKYDSKWAFAYHW